MVGKYRDRSDKRDDSRAGKKDQEYKGICRIKGKDRDKS
jgi:hypothetical protein